MNEDNKKLAVGEIQLIGELSQNSEIKALCRTLVQLHEPEKTEVLGFDGGSKK